MLMIMPSIKGKFLPKVNEKNTTYVILVSFIEDSCKFCDHFSIDDIVGNKAEGPISKRVLQEKSKPNFLKNEHFLLPDKHTYVCLSGGKKCFFFGNARFEIGSFALLPTISSRIDNKSVNIDFLLTCFSLPNPYTSESFIEKKLI